MAYGDIGGLLGVLGAVRASGGIKGVGGVRGVLGVGRECRCSGARRGIGDIGNWGLLRV